MAGFEELHDQPQIRDDRLMPRHIIQREGRAQKLQQPPRLCLNRGFLSF
jgi:hypothetical protein